MVNFLILLDDFLATDTLNAKYLISHPIESNTLEGMYDCFRLSDRKTG